MCSAVRSIRYPLMNRHADFRNETAHRLSVLVVDDEESVRAFVERVLRDAGYEVTVASDGPDALKIVEQHGPFDVFVLDSEQLFKEKITLWENEAFVDKPITVDRLLQGVSLLLHGHTRGPTHSLTRLRD